MAYTIEKVVIWAGGIDDRPGGLAALFGPLADAGANLEFVFARRDKKGKGVVFMAPISGAAQTRAAKKAGVAKSTSLQALRVVGSDKVGLGSAITAALGSAGVNMRGLSAMALGRKSGIYIAFDDKKDAARAQRVLAKALRVK